MVKPTYGSRCYPWYCQQKTFATIIKLEFLIIWPYPGHNPWPGRHARGNTGLALWHHVSSLVRNNERFLALLPAVTGAFLEVPDPLTQKTHADL
jgi:hypothetical protein